MTTALRWAPWVLGALGLLPLFDAVIAIDDMVMFGSHRPKPDTRMLRWPLARLKLEERGLDELLDALGFAFMGACR